MSSSVVNSFIFSFIAASSLFVSEPNPSMFGNEQNPRSGSKEAINWSNENWLKSRFHFSFAEYHSQNRNQFGVLRVLNDDLVMPLRGFGEHPHKNMEIVSYICSGELTHQDWISAGSKAETLKQHSVQYMSAVIPNIFKK